LEFHGHEKIKERRPFKNNKTENLKKKKPLILHENAMHCALRGFFGNDLTGLRAVVVFLVLFLSPNRRNGGNLRPA
jgi:hypothetical protein